MIHKNKKIKSCFSYQFYIYGYQYSLWKHVVILIAIGISVMILGVIMELNKYNIGVLIMLVIILTPIVVRNVYKNLNEQQRFMDIANYMEQLLYAFQRHSKILTTLEDTNVIFQESTIMYQRIKEAIQYIQQTYETDTLYQNAFAIIEKEYECSLLKRIHNFLLQVEIYGGEYEQSLAILIQERNRWVSRIVETQKQKKIVKRNMSVSVILAILIVCTMTLVVPESFAEIKNNWLVQVSTITVLGINLCIWTWVQCRLTGSWLNIERKLSEKETLQLYHAVKNYQPYSIKQNIIRAAILFSTVIVVMYSNKSVYVVASVGLICVWIFFKKRLSYQLKRKKLRREVKKVFPEWMLGISLLLQTDNVQVSLEKSIAECPLILREELFCMLEALEKDPISVQPYFQFFRVVEDTEIQSSMKMLYAMSQHGTKEMQGQILTLVERNVAMQDLGEKIVIEDYLTGMNIFILVPMVIGAFKMMVDMGILIVVLIQKTNTVF